MERKLAAILAADVVGYSALMERDEAGTFERLRASRKELFEPEMAAECSSNADKDWAANCDLADGFAKTGEVC